MFRKRISWLASVATTAMLGVMLLGVGASQAAPPKWTMVVTPLPASVSPGSAAGYQVDIKNTGPSNISSLFLVSSPSNAVYATTTQGSCVLDPFKCTFGALNSGQAVQVIVAFMTPTSGSSFGVQFQLNTSGSTFSDKGGTSHGDSLTVATSTTLDSNPDFAGGFSLDGANTFTTGTNLTKRNPQSSSVSGPNFLGITIQEGGSFPDSGDDPCATATCIGQWDRIGVGNHSEGPVKVVLVVLGSTIQGNVSVDSINLYHTGDGVITNRCSSDAPPASEMPCILVSKVGQNYQIVAWLLHNGGARGLF